MRWLTILLIATLSAVAPSHAQDRALIARIAVDQALTAYGKGGLTEIKILSQDCYKRDLDKIFCIYLDTAAQQIDIPIADRLKLPRDDYFNGIEYYRRVGQVLSHTNLTTSESNQFLLQCDKEINTELVIAAAKEAAEAGG